MNKQQLLIATVAVVVALVVLLGLFPYIFMICWNNSLPSIFGIKQLVFSESLALSVMLYMIAVPFNTTRK